MGGSSLWLVNSEIEVENEEYERVGRNGAGSLMCLTATGACTYPFAERTGTIGIRVQ